MQGPGLFVQHLNEEQYHPRSDAHSNALCRGIVVDLLDQCALLREKAARGEVVAQLNHTVTVSFQRWNIDLALGPPPGQPEAPPEGERIRFAIPATVEVALEAKGVMTEHGKARLNRLRDFHAFHSHAHTYDEKVIAVGVVVVNAASVYWSPTRDESDITEHRNIERLVAETVDLYRNIPLRNRPTDGPGMEAMGVLVVKHDNLQKLSTLPASRPASEPTALVTRRPAPPTGDPLNYATMIARICTAYSERYG